MGVVAGFVPATTNFKAPRKSDRGGWDKPGHDSGKMIQRDRSPNNDFLARTGFATVRGVPALDPKNAGAIRSHEADRLQHPRLR